MEHENRYPHLDDTEFPDVESVDVYEYGNEYDYSRWTDNVSIKLCNVPWESDGSNAVKFDNEEERDKWFDELEGETREFPSLFHEMPKQNVKVPVPFPVAMTYNYVVVDIPVMPTDGLPLEFENSRRRYKRTFWFVMDVQSTAPNTTELVLLQDYWTNYINSVEIPFMMLRRGHAPMKMTNVEIYLSDPMHNNDYLLTPDVTYGRESIAHSQRWFPFGSGTKFLCVACTMPLDKLTGTAYQTSEAINSTPVFEDITESNLEVSPWSVWTQPVPGVNGTGIWNDRTSARPPETSPNATRSERVIQDYDIQDWTWALGGQDYHNTTVHIDHLYDMGIHSGVSVYAIPSDDADDFLKQMDECYPQWFSTVLGAFDVSADMFKISKTIQVKCNTSFTVYEVKAAEGILGTIQLKKSDFKYDTKYADITKLYTFPYSWLELQDDSGRVVEVHVEELSSNTELKFKTSMAFPWVNYNAFFEGVGGDGNPAVYEWRNVDGSSTEMKLDCSDWRRLMFSHDVPIFALYQQAERRWGCENAGTIEYGRLGAMTKYRNADDGANTSQWNERDMALVTEANENDGAAAHYHNTERIADAERDNLKTMATAEQTNENALADMRKTNTSTATKAERDMAKLQSKGAAMVAAYGNVKNGLDCQASINAALIQQDIEITQSIATTIISSNASVVGGTVSGAAFGAVGAAVGASAGAIQAIAATVSLPITILADKAALTISNTLSQALVENAQANTKDSTQYMCGYYPTGYSLTGGTASYAGDAEDGISYKSADKHATSLDNQATLDQSTHKSNATNIKNAKDTCADHRYAQVTDGAREVRDSRIRNAARTRYRDYNNRIATQNTLTRQAKRTMMQDRRDLETGFVDAAHSMPVTCGQYMGDGSDDVMKWRGLQVKVRTQTDSAIAQAGDQMLRYGYMLNQSWDFDGFNVMPKFTYWEVDDLWLFGGEKGVPEDGQEYIKSMLKRGVTVWHNPDDMGRCSIYENR